MPRRLVSANFENVSRIRAFGLRSYFRTRRDRNPLTRVSCWARRPRSRCPCAEAPAYKFLESRVLSSFVFSDTTA